MLTPSTLRACELLLEDLFKHENVSFRPLEREKKGSIHTGKGTLFKNRVYICMLGLPDLNKQSQ
uniref:Uncharacterized protein n=1 Tax=Anguilla anguilla TaxID=7936 RepID=A0A0E9R9J2_ANGAN